MELLYVYYISLVNFCGLIKGTFVSVLNFVGKYSWFNLAMSKFMDLALLHITYLTLYDLNTRAGCWQTGHDVNIS